MPDPLLQTTQPFSVGSETIGALERAAAAIARLDQALAMHPLLPAFLHRARLEAVRRQAAVDGQAIDPWHLAAVLEGLRLRMDGALRIVDRGAIFDAARHALSLHRWITAPDFAEEGLVRQAEAALDGPGAAETPLLSAAQRAHAWLDAGGGRAPLRAALIRHWQRHRLLRALLPLTGARALGAEVPWERETWIPAFLDALAEEAADGLQRLAELERAWFSARQAVAGRRRHSRAPQAVDLLAAAPLLSATSLALGLGMAVKNATALLDNLRDAGVAVEVTHRSKRRLFGLQGMAPLRDEVAPPRRPEPGRGRGQPPVWLTEEAPAPSPAGPLTPVERWAFDYTALDHWMAQTEQAMRQTRRTLDALVREDSPTPAGGMGSTGP